MHVKAWNCIAIYVAKLAIRIETFYSCIYAHALYLFSYRLLYQAVDKHLQPTVGCTFCVDIAVATLQ